jgi:hypothetical protein
MPAKNPRINVVVEETLYGVLCDLAENAGVSMSALARDLIREAVILREDAALADFADKRMRTFDKNAALSHQETWK